MSTGFAIPWGTKVTRKELRKARIVAKKKFKGGKKNLRAALINQQAIVEMAACWLTDHFADRGFLKGCPYDALEDNFFEWDEKGQRGFPPSFCSLRGVRDYEGNYDEECDGDSPKCWEAFFKHLIKKEKQDAKRR